MSKEDASNYLEGSHNGGSGDRLHMSTDSLKQVTTPADPGTSPIDYD
jgi:hypothetical protein